MSYKMARARCVKVEVRPDHHLLVTFDNGETRLFDVKPYFWHPAFQKIQSPGMFGTVKPAGLSIEWINGADICPDALYYDSVPVKEEDYESLS